MPKHKLAPLGPDFMLQDSKTCIVGPSLLTNQALIWAQFVIVWALDFENWARHICTAARFYDFLECKTRFFKILANNQMFCDENNGKNTNKTSPNTTTQEKCHIYLYY